MTTMSASNNTDAAETFGIDGGGDGSVDGNNGSDAGGIGVTGLHNGREARNLAEKQRRDKLNASIQELATMVPHVADSTRRLDKTAVLRFATHGLRLQYVFGKSTATRRKRKHCLKSCNSIGNGSNNIEYRDPPHLSDTLMQLLDSFFLTLTCNGQIVLISASVEQLLGHCQSDLYGQNILQITHPDDQALLRQLLIPRDIETLFCRDVASNIDDRDNMDTEKSKPMDDALDGYYRTPSPRTLTHLAAIDERLRADRRCFTVRLARATTRSEATRNYELVKIDGCFRRSDSSVTGGAGNFPIVSQLIRRSRNNSNSSSSSNGNFNGSGGGTTLCGNSLPCLPQHDAIAQAALHGISGNDIVLVAMARIIREPRVMLRQPEANQLEYRTRHLIDGRIIDCDQRIGIVAGYMKDEVRNLSPFSFMHQDDVRWVIVALRQMYDDNSDYGESCYRLLSRNGNFIYLQTKGFLEIDKSNNRVHSFLCVNTLLDEEIGRRKVQDMKNKFSTIINAKVPDSSLPDLPASRNPQQLERIVLYLIENLHKCGADNGAIATAIACSSPLDNSNGGGTGGCNGDLPELRSPVSLHEDYAQTPSPSSVHSLPLPLALVPPEPSSVKNSISKSVSVVNITAAKNLQYHQRKSPGVICRQLSETSSTLSPASSVDQQMDELNNSTNFSNNTTSSHKNQNGITTTSTTPPPPTTTPTPTAAAISTSPVKSRNSVLQRLPLSITITEAATPATIPTAAVTPASTQVAAVSVSDSQQQQQQQQQQQMQTSPPLTPPTNNKCSVLISTTSAQLIISPTTTACTTYALSAATSPTTKLHAAISSSFRHLDNNLQTLGEEAQSLYQQRTRLLPAQVPCQTLDRQLDAILVEHQKQKQLLVNIKSEYDVHLQQEQHEQQQQQQNASHVSTVTTEQRAALPASSSNGNTVAGISVASVITSNVALLSRQRHSRRPL